MPYKELVERDISYRNKVVPESQIKVLDADYIRYCSMFSYDESILDYVKTSGSVSNYPGIYHCDALWFDIDDEDLFKSHRSCLQLVDHLSTFYLVSPDDLFIYFSGKKGFHIALHGRFFGNFTPSADLPEKIKQLAKELSKGIECMDYVIYEGKRIFRIANSKHQDSGLYKIELSYDELKTLPVGKIKEMAIQPRPLLARKRALSSIQPNELLVQVWESITSMSGAEIKYADSGSKVGFWKPVSEGGRDNQLFRQAAELFDRGLSQTAVHDILWSINQNCRPPLSAGDLVRIVNSAANKTRLNAKKEGAAQSLAVKPFSGWLDEFLDYIYHPTNLMTTGFKSFDEILKNRLKGKLAGIIGYGGSKKSLFALNSCMKNIEAYNCVAVYSTMEMSVHQLLYRVCDYLVEGKHGNASEELHLNPKDVIRDLLHTGVSSQLGNRLQITENRSMTAESYDKILQRVYNETGRVDMLVVDGLSMMGGKDSETERYSNNTKDLKDLANKWNIYIQIMCHVSKGGDKHTRDLQDKVRGSEKILDNCDFVITMSQIIDEAIYGETTEYRTDKGYARLYDKRGTGRSCNKIYDFNGRNLMLRENDEDPKFYESKKGKSKGDFESY